MKTSARSTFALGTLLAALASTPAMAFDNNTFSSALGGGIGGALGAALGNEIGNEIGGQTGALIGSAVGAAGGTLITNRNYEDSNDNGYDRRYDDGDRYNHRRYGRYSSYRH